MNFTVNSASLEEDRLVSVFLPPGHRSEITSPVLYCADGQALPGFARELGNAISQGRVPPIVLIGVHSDPDYRNREYLSGMDTSRFAAHELFFTDEVYRWSHEQFALSTASQSCGVFGFSCGAAFAVTIGTRHRNKYGNVIAFSVAGGTDQIIKSEFVQKEAPRYYLSAGLKELSFRETSKSIADVLTTKGIVHRYTEMDGGHDITSWAAELPDAIQWCFAESK